MTNIRPAGVDPVEGPGSEAIAVDMAEGVDCEGGCAVSVEC